MTGLILDGLRAPNGVFSQAGWSALVLTAAAVLGAMALGSEVQQLPAVVIILAGTMLQLLFTLVLAGLKQREDR